MQGDRRVTKSAEKSVEKRQKATKGGYNIEKASDKNNQLFH